MTTLSLTKSEISCLLGLLTTSVPKGRTEATLILSLHDKLKAAMK